MMPFWKPFLAVLVGMSLILQSGVAAAPTPQGKRPAPLLAFTSSNDIVPQLRPLHDNALFYSGQKNVKYDGRAATVAYAHRQLGLTVLAVAINNQYMKAHQNAPRFWYFASEAMALAATGKVYVLLPTGATPETWYKDSFWAQAEWPTLCKNPHVTHIIQLDAGQSRVDIAGVGDLKGKCP
jgi:hypothetical protein